MYDKNGGVQGARSLRSASGAAAIEADRLPIDAGGVGGGGRPRRGWRAIGVGLQAYKAGFGSREAPGLELTAGGGRGRRARETMTADQIDACSGIAITFMAPRAIDHDGYSDRLMYALNNGDAEQAEHITAVMVVMMVGRHARGELPQESLDCVQQAWSRAWGFEDR